MEYDEIFADFFDARKEYTSYLWQDKKGTDEYENACKLFNERMKDKMQKEIYNYKRKTYGRYYLLGT